MHLQDLAVMPEGTYIFVGTEGIPLHTWHALPSEAASVTFRPEGKAGQGSGGRSAFAPRLGVHCEHELLVFVGALPPPPPQLLFLHRLCTSSPVTIWSAAPSALWAKKAAERKL